MIDRIATPIGARLGLGLVGALLAIIAGLSLVLWIKSGQLETARNERAACGSALNLQNAAVADWKRQVDDRRKDAQAALATARTVNEAQAPQIIHLKASAALAAAPGAPCTISDTLKEATGL